MKKILSMFLSIVVVVSSLLCAAFAQETNNVALSFSDYYCNIQKSNDSIMILHESFEIKSDNDRFPEYFAGTSYAETGELIVYITDDSPEIKGHIVELCKNGDIEFIKVEHSFNELFALYQSIVDNGGEYQFYKLFINVQNNCLDIFFEDDEQFINVYGKIRNDSSEYETKPNSLVKCHIWDNTKTLLEQIEYQSGFDNYSLSERKTVIEVKNEELYAEFEKSDLSSTYNTRATVTVQPGIGYSVTSSGNIVGTIGAIAVKNGEYCLITHAHDLTSGTPIYVNSQYVGRVTERYYSSSYYGMDASLITNDGSNTIYPYMKVRGTGAYLNTYYTSSQLASMGVVSGYYAGNGAGTGGGSFQLVAVEQIYFCTSGAGSVIPYLSMNEINSSGDSGGPIVLISTSGTSAGLLGIIKGNRNSEGVGVPTSNIRSGLTFSYFYGE